MAELSWCYGFKTSSLSEKKFEDTKELIRSYNSKDGQYKNQKEKDKYVNNGRSTKTTQNRKLKIEQHDRH